jgi:hypothetical protein
MPAKGVKAYVKRNKNDVAEAEAICEAVGRPTMRFVQVKSAEQPAKAAPIGRVRSWWRSKGTGDGRMRLRLCVHELQSDDDVDSKQSRPSIGKPVMGHARKERVLLYQRITSGPASPVRQIPLGPRAPSIHGPKAK